MLRRMLFGVLIGAACTPPLKASKLGDAVWFEDFKRLVKAFNHFTEKLNDNIVDRKAWKDLEDIWHEMDERLEH